MAGIIEFGTERLRLRQWAPQDHEPFAAMNADPEVMKYFASVGSREGTFRTIDVWQSELEERGWSNWAVVALATYDRAIALDRNHAAAYVGRARNLNVIGRAAEALAPIEKAIRLSPRDPDWYVWYFALCHANTHLARDAQAIEWCLKSLATGKTYYFAYVDLASAYAWRGQNAQAAAAVAELLKLRPGFTVQALVQEGSRTSDNPSFRKEFQRIVEGARKAGLPDS